jgi:signal transduction histidine kinase
LLERRVAERTKEVEMYSNQLRGLAGQLVRAEETERRRIADILHEDLQQILVATRMTLGVALQMTKSAESKTTLAAADGMLDQSIRLTRSLVQDISVPAVREGELPYAVDWLRQQMQEKFNFTVDVTIAGTVPTVSESVYLCLYRSIQELLFNVVKHGRVDRAEVVVRKGCGASVEVIIRDRGCGFSEEAVSQSEKGSKGFGLFSIRERLEGLGGKLDLASAVGKGTTVVLTAPARG